MKTKTYIRAYKRVMSGEASESELKMLLLWAMKEREEWGKFISLINKKLGCGGER